MGSQEQTDLEFRTTDMALAAYLCCEGHRFLRIEGNRGTHIVTIIFDADDDLVVDVEEYQSGNALVEPLTFQKKVYWLRNKINKINVQSQNGRRRAE